MLPVSPHTLILWTNCPNFIKLSMNIMPLKGNYMPTLYFLQSVIPIRRTCKLVKQEQNLCPLF